MRFLFADTTTAPFDVHLPALVRGVVEYAVEVLDAAERIRARRATVAQHTRAADRQLARIGDLGKRLVGALRVEGQDPVALLAERITRAASREVGAAVGQVKAALSRRTADAESDIERERARCVRALEALLVRHDLPGARARLELRLGDGGRYAGTLRMSSELGLVAAFELAVPADHRLAGPVRVGDVDGRLVARVPCRGWLRRRERLARRTLTRLYVVALTHSGHGSSIALRTAPVAGAAGYDLVFEADADEVQVIPVGADGEPALAPSGARGDDAAALRRFEQALVALAVPLAAERVRMTEARLRGTPVAELPDPEAVLTRLLEALAPLVQEVVRRSPSPSELVVWRVDEGGRRERLVVPRAELEGVAARLPDRLRAPLAPLGLACRAAPPPPPRTSTEIDQGWDDDSDAAPPPRPPARLDSAGPLH